MKFFTCSLSSHLILPILLLLSYFGHSQTSEIDPYILQIASKSDLVVEGKFTGEEEVRVTEDGNVYTVLMFEVEDRITGFFPDRKIEIAIAGGLHDGILYTAMHNPIRYKDRYGIYFLKKSVDDSSLYSVVEGNAGQIVRGDRGDNDRAIIAAMRTGEHPYRKVKERIGFLLGSDLSIRALTKDGYDAIFQQSQQSVLNGPTMCVKIANPTPNL